MGWFSDATGIKTPQVFRNFDDANRALVTGGASLATSSSNLVPGMKSGSGSTDTSWKSGIVPAVSALKNLTFDANGNLNTPEYAGLSQEAINALKQGQQPSSYLGQAQQFYDSLMGGQSNPYLDATFGKAADAVKQRLDSQFAQAGRYGSDAHQNVMADQYNELANQVYGGQYNQDQANRMSALGMSGDLAQQQYMVPYQAAAIQQADTNAANQYDYSQGMDMINNYLAGLGASQSAKYAPQLIKAQTMGGTNQAMANAGLGLQAIGTIGKLFGA